MSDDDNDADNDDDDDDGHTKHRLHHKYTNLNYTTRPFHRVVGPRFHQTNK